MAKQPINFIEAARKRGLTRRQDQRRGGLYRQHAGNVIRWEQAPERLATQSVPRPGEDGEPESTSARFQFWTLVVIVAWALLMVGLRIGGVL